MGDPNGRTADELEDDGYWLDEEETEYDIDGTVTHYDAYVNDEGDEVRLRTGAEGRNDLLGFDDDERAEDNLP